MYLNCAHCGCDFLATYKQAWNQKHGRTERSFCSKTCQSACFSAERRQKIPEHGPCPTCGKMFESRTSKIYCSITCYTTSTQFAAMQKRNNEAAKKKAQKRTNKAKAPKHLPNRYQKTCRNCETVFYVNFNSRKRKYCSPMCRREFFAARFDRWIASPQKLALPQAYDEFLTQDELPCLVEGCSWIGQHLTCHMNQAHGVPANEFKRAAGFNLGTGVVARPTHEKMSEHTHNLLACGLIEPGNDKPVTPHTTRYRSLEAREHARKSRALLNELTENIPIRVCASCGASFQQRYAYTYQKYCSVNCRQMFYARKKKSPTPAVCFVCHNTFSANHEQRLRIQKNKPVVCGPTCRGKYAAKQRYKL